MTRNEPESSIDKNAGWLSELTARFEKEPDYVAETLAIDVIEQAVRLMNSGGLTRSELAQRMNVSRAYVTRLFGAPPNLTLSSIARLGMALGATPSVSLTSKRPVESSSWGVVTTAGEWRTIGSTGGTVSTTQDSDATLPRIASLTGSSSDGVTLAAFEPSAPTEGGPVVVEPAA
jgi:AraC-like DNA-binding protein